MLTEDEFFIEQLYKHSEGGKVLWSFVFRGKRVVMTTKQMLCQRRFRCLVADIVGELPPRRAPRNYDHWIDNLARNCIEKENADSV